MVNQHGNNRKDFQNKTAHFSPSFSIFFLFKLYRFKEQKSNKWEV